MVDSLRPGVLEEWAAFERIEPFGDEQLTRLFMKTMIAMGVENLDWDELRTREPVREDGPTMDETASVVSQLFGR